MRGDKPAPPGLQKTDENHNCLIKNRIDSLNLIQRTIDKMCIEMPLKIRVKIFVKLIWGGCKLLPGFL